MENLSQLSYGYHENRFLVRIIRKWESFSFHTYYTAMINFILLDTKNEQYWAVAPISEHDRLLLLVFPGMLYYIAKFKIVAAQASTKPIDTDMTLVFSKNTEWLDYVLKSSIPHFKFPQCPGPDLISRANHRTVLSDIAGVITQVGDIEYQRYGIKRLNLTLIDKSLTKLHVSLWEIKARWFQRDFKDYRDKNVVAMIAGLLVKKKKGNIYFSSTPATRIFFNPECPEVHRLTNNISCTYGDFICRLPHEIEPQYQALPQTNIITPCLTLRQILRLRLWIYQTYRCNVTLTDILLHNYHHSGSCHACKGFVSASGTKYYCAKCGRNFVTPVRRPSIVLHVMDNTGHTKVTIQPPELKQLTGYSRKELLKNSELVNGTRAFPKALEIIQGAQCTFAVMLTPSSYSNTTGTLMVDKIIQYAKMQPGNKFA